MEVSRLWNRTDDDDDDDEDDDDDDSFYPYFADKGSDGPSFAAKHNLQTSLPVRRSVRSCVERQFLG